MIDLASGEEALSSTIFLTIFLVSRIFLGEIPGVISFKILNTSRKLSVAISVIGISLPFFVVITRLISFKLFVQSHLI